MWTPGGLVRAAVACVIVLIASLVPALAAIAGDQVIDHSFAYACQLPSGTQPVTVRVFANVPDTVTAGRPIRLGKVTVLVALPAAAVADLTEQGAATVGGTLRLTPLVTVNGSPARITGSDFAIADTPVGADELVLTGSGQEPAPTVAVPGRAVFSVTDLDASLTLRRADGTAAQPAAMSFSCTPNLGQDTALATVVVSAPDGSGAAGRGTVAHATAAKAQAQAQEGLCPPNVTGGFSEDFPLPVPPPGTSVFENPPMLVCAKISGFSNVAKLNAAAPLFGKMALAVGNRVLQKFDAKNPTPENNYFELDSIGVSHVETTQATFLTFGFMPTTAKLDITQVGKATAFQNANITAVDYAARMPGLPPRFTTASAYVSLRIHDVQVNGVPLDVGPDCTTAQPMELQVSASTDDDPNYVVNTGGFLSGTATSPPFHGCGVGEKLDPLFTGSVSGPGNFIKITQGQICDPEKPLQPGSPCPVQDFGWDVEPGGAFTAGSGQFKLGLPGAAVSCASASFNVSFSGGKSVNGATGIGSASRQTFASCHGEGALTQAATMTVAGSNNFSLTTYDPVTDVVAGELANYNGIIRDGSSCTIRIRGSMGFRYSNVTHEMSLTRESSTPAIVDSVTAGCGGAVNKGDPVDFSGSYAFGVPQKIIRPGYR
jgi:hypothetical protein